MPLLKYDISVVGVGAVERALSNIERRVVSHNARMTRDLGGSTRALATRGAGVDAAARELSRIGEIGKAARMGEHRQAMRAIRDEERARLQSIRRVEQAERAAARAAHEARRSFARGTMGALGGAGRTIAGVGAAGVGLLGVGGSFAVMSALKSEMDSITMASKLANQMRDPSLKPALLQRARGIEGFSPQEALAGMTRFMDITGNAEISQKMLPEMSKLALATGSDLTELSEAAANAFIPIKDNIKDANEQLKMLEDTMRAVAGMGTAGAIEIKTLTPVMGGLVAAGRKFAGGPGELIKDAVAIAQAARQRGGATEAAEAVTSFERFVSDTVEHSKRIEAGGIKAFAGKKGDVRSRLRSPKDLLFDIIEKTGGDLPKIMSMYGIRAERTVEGFAGLYTAKGGGKAGREAIEAEWTRLRSAALSQGEVEKRFRARMADPDKQFEEAFKPLRAALARELLPALVKVAPEMAKLAPPLARVVHGLISFATWLAKHPFTGVGIMFGAALTKELGKVGLKAIFERALLGAIGGGGPVGVPGGGPKGGAVRGVGVLGAAGAVLAAVAGRSALTGAASEALGMKADKIGDLPMFNLTFGLGRKGGSFSFGQLAKDIKHPVDFAARQVDTLDEIANRGAQMYRGKDPQSVIELQKGLPTAGKDLQDAAVALKEAAESVKAAAATQGGDKPPRGAAPSPVK